METKNRKYELEKKCEESALILLRTLRVSSKWLYKKVEINKINTKEGEVAKKTGNAYIINWSETVIHPSTMSVDRRLPQIWGEPQYGTVEYDTTSRNTISEGIITLYFV